ncbi:MAG: hypothetical protein NC920_03155 [Candidatus Omnitrophica bacterium]|nr:hypothetical protein [Candidatus Omnitrophota bacterium]MCM8798719.1 hypothetical protein [Candidatus Omnitrophota bacterium]
MRKVFYSFVPLIFIFSLSLSAQTTGEIQRSEELLEKEKTLRGKLERKERVFIKKIVVEGTEAFSEEEIKEIVSPFEKKWLDKEEIEGILDLFKEAYKKKNLSPQFSYQIKKHQLKILIKE